MDVFLFTYGHEFGIYSGLPDELRESIASLVYAASRCGEFPELQELRLTIARKYGKEVIARAVELPDHSGVNPEVGKEELKLLQHGIIICHIERINSVSNTH